ncbi:hypothetical protein ABTZ59_20885 [Streptomyces sp. NPDC094034]|uniref:hypothetical protein n=1 Tax=Streptomyces sp. NPDC094034 TaxID=3155309 RepID=UPI00332A90D5
MDTTNWGDGALLKFYEAVKDALDPNGHHRPRQSGVWQGHPALPRAPYCPYPPIRRPIRARFGLMHPTGKRLPSPTR